MSRTKADSPFGAMLMRAPRNRLERVVQRKVARVVLRKIEALGSTERAARYFSVSQRTIQRWIEKHGG